MSFEIRPASGDELPVLAGLEQEIEPQSPASLATLQQRYAMFEAGFLTASFQGRLIGYAQSCRWNLATPAFEAKPDFFSSLHRQDAPFLYLIFVGVLEEHRKQGAGSLLVGGIQELARQQGCEKVQAVTWPHLIHFYENLGFIKVKEIPGFLAGGDTYFLLEWVSN